MTPATPRIPASMKSPAIPMAGTLVAGGGAALMAVVTGDPATVPVPVPEIE